MGQEKTLSTLISIIIALGAALFLFWLLTVATPVLGVEIKYQYHTLLRDVFHIKGLGELLPPNFFVTANKNTANGVSIPKLFIDEPIVYNVDPNDKVAYTAALKKGIAHASGTAFPGNGGFGYYFAHSSTPEFANQYNAIFYLLGKLEPGDEFSLWHEGSRSDYVVTQKKITDPTDISFLKNSYPKETVVLQTCWPPGTTQKRLLVYGEVK